MSGNKVAYDAAYQRALDGKSSQSWWSFLTTPFEDEYTRQSRQRGERDGAAARDKHTAPEAATAVN
jgi:hypothetical protein